MPLRINAPPPLTLNDVFGLLSFIEPAMLNALPGEAVTFRLLPKTIGAAIVWLPPLLLSVAGNPPVFAKVSVAPFNALI